MIRNIKPVKQGLYDPVNEHDACGVGFIANIKGRKSHDIITNGLQILKNLAHRGATGADPLAGDGAGILLQIPDAFFRQALKSEQVEVDLPPVGEYGVAMLFLPQDAASRGVCEHLIEATIAAEGQQFISWRDVPTSNDGVGEGVRAVEPVVRQVFIKRGAACLDVDSFERKLFVIRKIIENKVFAAQLEQHEMFYITSMSARTVVYKGMLLARQLGSYYPDLSDTTMASAMALVHQRFSTNTFPSWDLAQPFRMVCHNGEINTLRGNVNWMAARRHAMTSSILGNDLEKLWPLISEGRSDSACFDNALELLVAGGYSLAHAMMLLIPEAWARNPLMDDNRRAFYEYHASLIEPWDGPAAMAFTDGRQIGATLDRNGLRPARFVVTNNDLVVMSSEVGVLDIPEQKIVKKWRLQPGKMFLIDLEAGRIIDDKELKDTLAAAHPYQEWLNRSQIMLEDLPAVAVETPDIGNILDRQQAFGYSQEDLKFIISPMVKGAEEAIGSMGNDTPLSVLSDHAKPLYSYFKQLFAQVTNPPIDPIREELVMSLVSFIGPRPNLLGLDNSEPHQRLEVQQPVLGYEDMEKIRHIADCTNGRFRSITLTMCYPVENGGEGMEAALGKLCAQAERAYKDDYNIIILSDRDLDQDHVAIPALLALSAVHHHLIRSGHRTRIGLVVESGSAREVHHFAMLAGYGAEAVHPYLAFETIAELQDQYRHIEYKDACKRYIKAINKGLLKIMSKMGISTYQSYCGAQIFEAVGLSSAFIDRYFTGTATKVEGIGLAEIAEEALRCHRFAYSDVPQSQDVLNTGGVYAFRVRGEAHMWTPDSISKLQHSTRANSYKSYKEYANLINNQSKRLMTLRGLLEFKQAASPVTIDEVEPAAAIVKRFSTGAMSFGSISREAHTTLAIAMNRLGGKSNTGEGGEEPERFIPLENGDSMRSAIKQVASGRFGVTNEYLVNADQIQIKMAQGAKPGEGGQLPGRKVSKEIARVRHSVPGVGLISPPPHHDIYSIEDLAQLIHDLKNANPRASISVKLVSEVGVGTVAAGVSKAHADHVTIAGHDGGTGASPWSSIMYAGSPWEIGLSETHQTLVLNDLRGRIAVQVDGQMKTGRDVVIGALLGADEFGFATAPLVVEGCIMMRKCHLNTCPVGVATQDPELRKRFTGQPEHVVNFFFFVAEEIREIMASMGFRRFDEMIGRSDLLDMRKSISHWKANGLDFSGILHQPDAPAEIARFHCQIQDHGLDNALDHQLIAAAQPALEQGKTVIIDIKVKNINRTFATMLSGEVARHYGYAGLPHDTICIRAIGTGGQSFGAFLAHGISIVLQGDANDYVGKGLSGGRVVIMPPPDSTITPEENIIVGNTVLYGAISGECYFRGVAGERFAVRNSGAAAVVEGVGDHGCEYMTGGTVVVLGGTGRNFAAGMSGGIAYVFDSDGDFHKRCNLNMVDLETIVEDGKISTLSTQINRNADIDSLGNIKHLEYRDEELLYRLIYRHHYYTNSELARGILDNWKQMLPKFVKVMPKEYRLALAELSTHAQQTNERRVQHG